MPDVVQEKKYNGKPVLEFYLGEWDGKSQFFSLGVKKLSIVDDNIDRVRQFLDKHEQGRKKC